MPVLEDIQNHQTRLIRKMVAASMFVAPETATLPATLTIGGVSEVQTVTITGGPTGGTFTLTLSGETTAAIAYNATAADVRTALEALSNVGTGNVTTGGGPLPGTAVTVTFDGSLGNVAQMTATSSLTGGTSPAVTVATTTEGTPIELAALPSGYVDLGLVTKDDGFSFGNEWDMAETASLGYADPTRRDILRSTSTIGLTAQETKRRVLEMFHQVDLSAVAANATSGEVSFSKPLQPGTRYYRSLLIGRDGVGSSAIYMGVLYPRAMVSETGEQSASEESEFGYPMTLTATPDTSAGYAVRYLFGGPGWRSLLTEMGW
jgi:hypothetical protein